MYILRKWNYDRRVYEPFISPANVLFIYSNDLDTPTDCAECGCHTTYGVCYTSRTIHTAGGLGFPVCEQCYQKEFRIEQVYKATLR